MIIHIFLIDLKHITPGASKRLLLPNVNEVCVSAILWSYYDHKFVWEYIKNHRCGLGVLKASKVIKIAQHEKTRYVSNFCMAIISSWDYTY